MLQELSLATLPVWVLAFVYFRYYVFRKQLRFSIKVIALVTIGIFLAESRAYLYVDERYVPLGMYVFRFLGFAFSLVAIKATLGRQLLLYGFLGCFGLLLYSVALTLDDVLTPARDSYYIANLVMAICLLLTYRPLRRFHDVYLSVLLEKGNKFIIWVAAFSVLASYLLALVLYYPFLGMRTLQLLLARTVALTTGLVCSYFITYLYALLRSQLQLTGINRAGHWMWEAEQQYYNYVHRTWEETRRERHNLRHQVLALRELAAKEEYAEIITYVAPSLVQKSLAPGAERLLKNFLHYWREQAQEHQVALKLDLDLHLKPLQAQDTAIFLNAVLKDAVTAAIDSGADLPQVEFRVWQQETQILLDTHFSCNAKTAELYEFDVEIWQIYAANTSIDNYTQTMQFAYSEGQFRFWMVLYDSARWAKPATAPKTKSKTISKFKGISKAKVMGAGKIKARLKATAGTGQNGSKLQARAKPKITARP